MRFNKLIAVAMVALTVSVLGSCRGHQTVADSYANYQFPTTCVNVSPTGSLTVRSWGNGHNKATAIEDAKRKALNELIFSGIKGSNNPLCKALVTEVNARERYAEYFDRFFANGGEYRKFVKETSATDDSRVKAKNNGRESYGVTLDIDRSALRSQLVNDGLLSK
ncbi:MAG: hypothetical protein K2N10_00170 [Muribaculaceae bacterium]|nr:hypothetical protein [Muribaculaceae bacterium]